MQRRGLDGDTVGDAGSGPRVKSEGFGGGFAGSGGRLRVVGAYFGAGGGARCSVADEEREGRGGGGGCRTLARLGGGAGRGAGAARATPGRRGGSDGAALDDVADVGGLARDGAGARWRQRGSAGGRVRPASEVGRCAPPVAPPVLRVARGDEDSVSAVARAGRSERGYGTTRRDCGGKKGLS